MPNCLWRGAFILAFLGGVACASTPVLAIELSGESGFGAASRPIGPGASLVSHLDVNFGPLGAGVFIAPEIAFGVPIADDTIPDQGWAPIAPSAAVGIGSN